MRNPLPNDALDDRLAIVGRSGYGKTNAGKVKESCTTCAGRGWVILDQGGHNCRDCSNLRCVKCGGEGKAIEPRVAR